MGMGIGQVLYIPATCQLGNGNGNEWPPMEKPPQPQLGAPMVPLKGPHGNFLGPPRSFLGLLIANWDDVKAFDTAMCDFHTL